MEKKYTPCGGCGATEPDQRCIGCMHPFTEIKSDEPPATTEWELINRIVSQWGNAVEMPNMEQWLKDYAKDKSEQLERWKAEAICLLSKIDDYTDGHPEIKLGMSKVDFTVERAMKFDEVKPGARWVKASERLPGLNKPVKWRSGGVEMKVQQLWYMVHDTNSEYLSTCEWYDESAAGREDIDVDELWDEHAEYIDDNIDELIRWAGCTVVTREQFNKMMDKFKQKEDKV